MKLSEYLKWAKTVKLSILLILEVVQRQTDALILYFGACLHSVCPDL